MTFDELVRELCWWEHGFKLARMRRILRRYHDAILEELREGREVKVPKWGTYARATRKARRIRNPVTKELQQLPEMATVRFRAAKAAKERVR